MGGSLQVLSIFSDVVHQRAVREILQPPGTTGWLSYLCPILLTDVDCEPDCGAVGTCGVLGTVP